MKESEISVCFVLSGKTANLNEISDRLQITPTKTRALEDWPETITDPRVQLPEELRPHYVWQIDTGYDHSRLVRERFITVLRLLSGKEAIIRELKEQFSLRASFTIGVHAQHDQCNLPELFLTQEIIEFAAALGADIGFDMYLD